VAVLALPAAATAQPELPVSGFVVDVRGAVPSYPDSEQVATPRGATPDEMPSRGLGLEVGVGVYPARWKAVTFGFGLSYLASRASRTPQPVDDTTPSAEAGVRARVTALSPQVSLNFGHRMGWSYLGGGIGWSTFRAWRDDGLEEPGESTKTINYGGGARWFLNPHLAFSLDLRFYAMAAKTASANTAGHPNMTLVVAAVGVSLR
jgi:hypothetical protein